MEPVKNDAAPVTNENGATEQPKQVVTLESLQADVVAKKSALATVLGNPDATDAENMTAVTDLLKAQKAVEKFVNDQKAAERLAEIEKEMEERKSKFWNAIKAYDVQKEADATLAKIPVGKRTEADIAAANDAKAAFDAAAKEVTDVLAGKRPNVTLHVAGNVTGEKLENAQRKTGVGKEIVDLYISGKTAKEIIAMGYSRGTTGAVILAYEREKGLKPAKD